LLFAPATSRRDVLEPQLSWDKERGTPMQVEYARCCGLDVHQKRVVACVLVTAEDGSVQRQVRTFATMTADLLALNDWLNAQQVEQVEQVAMESTGV
jgi:transposase